MASAESSLHFTLRPMQVSIQQRAGAIDDKTLQTIDRAFDRHCFNCHSSCGQCHVSRPNYANGGFLSAHRFVKTPSMDTTCASCHGGRVYREFIGGDSNYEADLHHTDEDMTCTDCHTSNEMHASASTVKTRLDLPELPICQTCHPDAEAENSSNRSHKIHCGKLACQVCHAQAGKSCFSCHVGTDSKGLPYYKCKASRVLFKIGLNPNRSTKRPYNYVVVRHSPVTPQTFEAYVKDELKRFDDLPTWKPSFPHSIRRITKQNKNCNSCHGNAELFLSKSDLASWETTANANVIVPEKMIPKKIGPEKD